MKTFIKPFAFVATPLLVLAACASAQEDARLNYIRDSLAFRVTDAFAPNPNNIEIYNNYCIDFQQDPGATGACSTTSPYGLDYEDFRTLLQQAYNEGRGGVIDFETPIPGPAFRDYVKTGYRAYMEQYMLDHPVEEFEADVRQQYPELGDADVLALSTTLQQQAAYAAAEAALLDTSVKLAVVNRGDRGRNDTEDRVMSESLATADIVGLYGPDKDIPLVISRGEMSYVEGQLATRNFQAPWDLASMANASFFTNVGISTYSGSGNNYRPVSGLNSWNGGAHDMLFDPRDNVTALGFVFLTFGNFQYYQGESGVPVNPSNMRVYVEFSNGETEELAQTSQQSSGNWDVFFGIRAPEGASITRVWLRVIGRNWRTFVSIDDLAFITEPALSYIVGDTTFTGSAGAEFYALLSVGQNPQSVSISGLPAGLSFDPATGLISGTFAAAGTFTATATLVNSVGTATETLVFNVAAAGDPAGLLQLDAVDPAAVVLRRSLPEVVITSNLDTVLPPGSIDFFSRVEKVLDDGSRLETSLDFIGLTLRDGIISGSPTSAQQIGNYEVTVYGSTATSSDKVVFPLSVLPPTQSPNFDSNKTSDFAVLAGDSLWTALNTETPGEPGQNPLVKRLSGISGTATLFLGDYTGDNRADFVSWDAGAGAVRLIASGENGTLASSGLLEGIDPSSGEAVVAAADFDGDGGSDLLWSNAGRDRISFWLMKNGRIKWAGAKSSAGGIGDLVAVADFAGDARNMVLTRTGAGSYKLEQFTTFTTLGQVTSTAIEFTLDAAWEPAFFADFTSDGRQDILWVNPETGAAMLWAMQGVAQSTSYFLKGPASASDPALVPVKDASGRLTGLPGVAILPAGFDWSVVTAADFTNDQYADLLLRNRQDGSLGLLPLKIGASAGAIMDVGGALLDVLAVGDYDSDARNDVFAENHGTGRLEVITIAAGGDAMTTDYAAAVAGGEWITDMAIDNAVQPIDMSFDWIGPFTFATNLWMYCDGWGWLGAGDTVYGIFRDPSLGWLWTSSEVWPFMYHYGRNNWIYYYEGTANPRNFYNVNRRRNMTETQLGG